MNGGIFMVSDSNGKGHIEKRMQRREIESGGTEREIIALQQVGQHSHITTMVDHYIDYRNKVASIYLERCTGSSLQRLIGRHGRKDNRLIAERYIWQWSMQIAKALSFCHYGPEPDDQQKRLNWNSIYHQDIKPGNILLMNKDGGVFAQLADFGGATSKEMIKQGRADPLNQSIFTKHFTPPEHPRFYGQSDIWQLGAVMVCLCNLTIDFKDALKAHPTCPAGPKYSPQLNFMITRSMHLDIGERPKSDHFRGLLQKTYNLIEDSLPQGPELLLPVKSSTSTRRRT